METLFIGRQRIEPHVVSSTNSMALEMLRNEGLHEGAVISTRHQTAGRGQPGNSWESEPGKNLALSVVLKPVFLAPSDQFWLTKVVSLAVSACVEQMLDKEEWPVRIKWPNDIYAGSRKIAGVLIENILRDHIITASVAGIGLNINQENFSAGLNACSLYMLTGKVHDPESCFESLCTALEARYLQLRNGDKAKLEADYRQRLYRLNENCLYKAGGESFYAVLTGVTPEGKLQLNAHGEEVREYGLKEITFLNPNNEIQNPK